MPTPPTASISGVSKVAAEIPPATALGKAASAWARVHSRPPETLFHYTTGDGLLGMLKGGRLWATNARFLNDPSEIQYAADLIKEVLQRAGEAHAARVKALHDGLLDRIVASVRDRTWKAPRVEAWAENAIQTFDAQGGAFITCFCREPDLLSQWRGYGAVGGGYAVGFSTGVLGATEGVRLRRVVYAPATQRRLIEQWVDAVFALDLAWRLEQKGLLEEMKATASKDWQALWATVQGTTDVQKQMRTRADAGLAALNDALRRFSEFMVEALVCFKNPAYVQEDEWRLIAFGASKPAVSFRVAKGCPVPYTELEPRTPDGKLPITKVTYGPVLESGMVARALETLLSTLGYPQLVPRVSQSTVPYRG